MDGNNKNYKRRNIYFDSNDEMFYESELTDEELKKLGKGKPHKTYTKITIKVSEEERKKMRENIQK
jgi:hypothetical protein